MTEVPNDTGLRWGLKFARRVPGYSIFRTALLDAHGAIREWLIRIYFHFPTMKPKPSGSRTGVVVSLTSFPDRIAHVWIAIESILRQSRVPDGVVLVLAEEQFPDRILPKKLRRQCKRGLEIIWTPDDLRSFKKLLPTIQLFPDATIITVDDDMIYKPWMVERIVDESMSHPHEVIGYWGREFALSSDLLAPFASWPDATVDTPSKSLQLIGSSAILYPPKILSVNLLCDYELAQRLCPHGDDIWFWAVARIDGVQSRCLAIQSAYYMRKNSDTPRLETINVFDGENDRAMARVVEFFSFDLS